MKKTLFILAAATALTACKKNNENATVETTTETSTVNTAAPADVAPVTTVTSNPNEVSATAPTPDPMDAERDKMVKDAQSKPLTSLVLSENSHSFGKIKKGEKVEHVYQVTNTGKNPLIISNVKPGCGCTAPTFTKEPIMPGQKGQITLAFDSSSFDGTVNKQAEVFANVEKTPILLTFSAEIQPK